ncbi:hypothetical protein [Nocardiopsis metallicus]|uniref:ABC-type enterobactin transport system permease subunit n=1 Tax=Nocardiopsis metallicus TaxID=179819 RepID=A0A840WFS1_9ACTN|nr:hypothetical protein [Nocardiopsis metallicus]MBB5490577.1 ABC-type enterobactin transport system permease subunit [Nocardiopsis metallicus]
MCHRSHRVPGREAGCGRDHQRSDQALAAPQIARRLTSLGGVVDLTGAALVGAVLVGAALLSPADPLAQHSLAHTSLRVGAVTDEKDGTNLSPLLPRPSPRG